MKGIINSMAITTHTLASGANKMAKKPPSQRAMLAYQAAGMLLFTWLNKGIRNWEKQPIQRRKWQLVVCLTTLLLLGSLSVYYTANRHFFTRITQNYHEQQPKVGPPGRK